MARTKGPNPIDAHVGARLRTRRMALGMSQDKLGASLGLTFQQVQKYEKGLNRMGSSRLQHAADILGVAVPFFFERLVSLPPSRSETLDNDAARLGPSSDHPMPLPPEQEVLCVRLEMGESCPGAAKVIRQQAHEIANLVARLNRAYARVPDEPPSEIRQEAA